MTKPQALLNVDGQVAVITLVNPPVNALHPDVIKDLFTHLRDVQRRSDIKAIVVTGANGKFCAGFDISQFGKGGLDQDVNRLLVELLESGPKPSVAAVEGVALGGGLEVAMACNARVCSPGTSLGLPELQLGIIPGFGGTQRLPRLVGLPKALQMMLTSQPIKDGPALKLGLVDQVAPAGQVLEAAKRLALELAEGRHPRRISLELTDKLGSPEEAGMVIEMARAQAAKQAKHLRHPQLCLDAVMHGVQHGGRAGLQKEAEAFKEAASLDTHKGLVHIFFAQRSTKRIKGVTDVGLKPRPIRRLAIIGGGLMGSGIATASLLAGVEVVLKEVNQQFLDAGLGRIKSNLGSRVKKGRMTAQAAEQAMSRVQGTLDYSLFNTVDMVIEAALENVKLKQEIFAELERVCRADAILASNTSTISLELVGAKTSCPDRILGAHFFSPAHIMPLLEIVVTDKTSKQVILDTLEFGSKIRKTPVVVGNCTGFAVNRNFFPYTMAAFLLADLGLDPYKVDKAIAAGFGMPMGPFRLSDLVGGDIGLNVGRSYHETYGDRVYASPLVMMMNEAKNLGEKTGKGYYQYDAKRKAAPNPELSGFLDRSRQKAGLLGKGLIDPSSFSERDIMEFIFFPVVNEACRVVDEHIVDKPADLDVCSVMAMGFPAWRGGIVFYGDLVGADYIHRRLSEWSRQFEAVGLGGFFKPCAYLERAARSGIKLSAGSQAASKL
ncbi:hypothetical protein N2152v2_001376 [Parachlorella kessleri]